MRIAQIAPPFESVPPTHYGGTERVIATLTEELARRGHDVTLFASGDSRTSARLVATVRQALWSRRELCHDFGPYWSVVLGKVLREIREFDIVHAHIDYAGFPLARSAPCPVVTTLHGRLDLPELVPLYQEYEDLPLVSISDAQRVPIPHANWVATIHHGIDLDQFTFNPVPGSYLAFLGRISPVKGLDTAIHVARRAGLPLKIAARMPLPFTHDPEVRADWDHFESVVQPLLRGPDVELIGQVGGSQKDEFLRNARALLFPIRWPEPFGLVMAEAMACGTPVVALRGGSVAEVVEHGVTGFVCETEDELVQAIGRLDEIDRAACRAQAEQRFSPSAMAGQYEQVYERLFLDRLFAPRFFTLGTTKAMSETAREVELPASPASESLLAGHEADELSSAPPTLVGA
jgi:glycosyltransferase involved in cell wall biosynthesis